MNEFTLNSWNAITEDFHDLLDVGRLLHVVLRLLVAALLGGVLGYQREKTGKPAGLRTHMLVSTGAAFFVIVPQLEHASLNEMSRIIQGIVAGIGFLCAGAILKRSSDQEIFGLTTAAGIWFVTAVGIAAGFGRLGTAMIGTALAYIILSVLQRFEGYIDESDEKK